MADESVVVKMVRTTQPDWSEGTLLYLKSFFGGEVGKNDKYFYKSTGTEGKDIQQGEDLIDFWSIGGYALLRREQESRMRENRSAELTTKPHVRFDVAGDGKVLWRT